MGAPASRGRVAARAVGRLVLLLALVACGKEPGASAPPPGIPYRADGTPEDASVRATAQRSVMLICLDTVRVDALAPWSKSPAMPETSAWFSRRGTAFVHASTAAPWTGPAVASLLTGLVPSRHGARELSGDFALVPSVTTIAEILGAQGWRRAAFTGGGWVSARNGVLQGFEQNLEPFSFAAGAPKLLEGYAAIGHAAWFVFAHTYEAHDPYLAPPASPRPHRPAAPAVDLAAIDAEAEADGGRALTRRFLLDWETRAPVFETAFGAKRIEAVTRYMDRGFRQDPQGPALAEEAKKAYTEGLRRLDRAVAKFLADSEAAGHFKDATVILTSDHGEAFGENGTLHHGRMLHDVLIHVPLLVVGPGFEPGRVVTESCSLLDVLPTICDLVGLPPPRGIDGRSLLPLAKGGPGRPVPAEERRTTAETGLPVDEDLVAIRDARWSWIRTKDRTTGDAREALYDREKDPGETAPLSATPDDVPAVFREAERAAREAAERR